MTLALCNILDLTVDNCLASEEQSEVQPARAPRQNRHALRFIAPPLERFSRDRGDYMVTLVSARLDLHWMAVLSRNLLYAAG